MIPRVVREGVVAERDGRAVVRFGAAGCGRDGPCACTLGTRLSDPVGRGIDLTTLGIPGDAEVGDRVTITVSVMALSRMAAVLFGLPLLALVGAAWLGGTVADGYGLNDDVVSALTGLAAAAAVLSLVTRSARVRAESLAPTAQLQRTDR